MLLALAIDERFRSYDLFHFQFLVISGIEELQRNNGRKEECFWNIEIKRWEKCQRNRNSDEETAKDTSPFSFLLFVFGSINEIPDTNFELNNL